MEKGNFHVINRSKSNDVNLREKLLFHCCVLEGDIKNAKGERILTFFEGCRFRLFLFIKTMLLIKKFLNART